MTPSPKLRLAFVLLSAALHGALVWIAWGLSLVPESPVKVELVRLPPRPDESSAPRAGPPPGPTKPKKAPAPERTPPPPEVKAEPTFAPTVRPRLVPRLALQPLDLGAKEPAAPDRLPAVADASAYGTGDARLTVVLRTDRVRDTRYAPAVRQLLGVFPDHQMLAVRTGLDPLGDLDSLLISTADPFDVTATFLAARYRFPEARLKRLFDRQAARGSGRIGWRTVGGRAVGELRTAPLPGLPQDPRVLVLWQPGVAVFTRPEHVAALCTSEVAGASPRSPASNPAWPARLSILEVEAGTDPDGPALLVALSDVRSFVATTTGERMPIPETARLMVTSILSTPTALVELGFRSETQARSFAAEWPARARRLASSAFVYLVGLSRLISRIEIQAQESSVRARFTVTPSELEQILRLLLSIGPAPPAPAASLPSPASQPSSGPRRAVPSRPAPPPGRRR
jgi:hypothetical protein